MVDVAPTQNQGALRPKFLPIGTDHLGFKHNPEIQGQLEPNGKCSSAQDSEPVQLAPQWKHSNSRGPQSVPWSILWSQIVMLDPSPSVYGASNLKQY